MSYSPVKFDGIEIDMLALGDADCIVVTQWHNSYPHRVLIDGGCGADYEQVAEFLKQRGFTNFWSVVCSHCHNDHASGLIKLIRNGSFTFQSAWMHDIRNHVGMDALTRAAAADDGVKQVVETTVELASAFRSRFIKPQEPFAGQIVAGYPDLQVLGPTAAYYGRVIAEFTNVCAPKPTPRGLTSLDASSVLGGRAPIWASMGGISNAPSSSLAPLVPTGGLAGLLSGALAKSSVLEEPETQPYNNTSTILGMRYGTLKYMLTADAGSDALDQIPKDWDGLHWMQVPHHGSDGNLSQNNIERFCPQVAFVSAKGDTSHPSRAIVNGLIKVGSNVYSTHSIGSLWHSRGTVPNRDGYCAAEPLKATGGMQFPSFGSISR